jgi:hypothetical protein
VGVRHDPLRSCVVVEEFGGREPSARRRREEGESNGWLSGTISATGCGWCLGAREKT